MVILDVLVSPFISIEIYIGELPIPSLPEYAFERKPPGGALPVSSKT
jgi:hypothetical protein